MVFTKANRIKKSKSIKFVSQNVRGLKSDARLEELFAYISRLEVFALCVQETWRSDNEILENERCLLVTTGLRRKDIVSKRGSQGVAIALSPDAIAAWRAAGSELHNDIGARVIAIRLLVKDHKDNDVFVFLVSAYAPVSTATDVVWDDYYDKLQTCIGRRRTEDILLIGTDSNSSIGRTIYTADNENISRPVGSNGLNHQNQSGRRFRTFLSLNNLRAATTFFRKKNYGTWQHPRSKKLHQLDHFVTNAEMFKCVRDAGITTPVLDSDHRALKCILRVQFRLKRCTDDRQKLLQLDYSMLTAEETGKQFCEHVRSSLNTTEENCQELNKAIKNAALETLPKKTKPQPGWFKAKESILLPLIEERNAAMSGCYKNKYRFRSQTIKLRSARKKLNRAVAAAKDDWIGEQCKLLNDGTTNTRGTKPAWDAVKKLKAGLSKSRPSSVKRMKKPDGTVCRSPEENADVFKAHFEELFGRLPVCDVSVLDLLEQLPVRDGLDHPPTDKEFEKAVSQLRNTAPGDSGLCAQAYKCLMNMEDTSTILKNIVQHFWLTSVPPEEWETSLLKILPKKGDLSLTGNHRGIMLLEVSYKIVANILKMRLLPIEEELDHESQCGFRPQRGCTDAVYTVKMALKKRREHGLESWVLFLDLVKAFDRVPRDMLWEVLKKFGVPAKVIDLIKSLHQRVKVKFSVDGITHIIYSIVGVKQGDILGPILFTFYVAAIMITWRKVFAGPVCVFRTKPDFVLTGRSYRAYGEEFPLTDSEYADDTAAIFVTRQSVDQDVPLLINHFSRWGMEVHTGDLNKDKNSKTEMLFCSKPPHMYEDPDTYDNANIGNINLGEGRYIPIVASFIYLGSVMARDCTDILDVRNRIEKAGEAFGAIRKNVLSSTRVSNTSKKFVYMCIILAILLYGSEMWCLTEALLHELRCFHARCVRSMCRVTRWHTRLHRISTEELLNRLNLDSIDTYINRRQLRWAGHVARMPTTRLPRKMLSSWVRNKRPCGAPRFTYGRTLKKALRKANLDVNNWHEMAENKMKWRNMIKEL